MTLGTYKKVEGVQVGGKPVWLKEHGDFFLYFSNQSSYWAVGQTLGGDVVRLENRGTGCPSKLTSSWRFADGGERSLVYDHSLKLLCPSGPCGREICGHNAMCDKNSGQCVCLENYEGDPRDRCFPRIGISI